MKKRKENNPFEITYDTEYSARQFWGLTNNGVEVWMYATRQSTGHWLPAWSYNRVPVTIFLSGMAFTAEDALRNMGRALDGMT